MDIQFLLWLQKLRGGVLDSVLLSLTDFVVSPAMYIFAAILYWCFCKPAAIFLSLNLSAGTFVNQILKNTFCIYRPWVRNPAVVPLYEAKLGATGYSFPSGHTQVAAMEFLSLAHWQKKRLWFVFICVFMTLLVGFTRMYLGVHTPQDVVVSLLLSVVIIFLNHRLLFWVEQGKNRDVFLLTLGSVLAAVMLLYTTFKPYPMDYAEGQLLVDPMEMITDCYAAAGCLVGFFVGWVLERRLLQFSTRVSAGVKIVRGFAGAVVLYLYAEFARDVLTHVLGLWGEFLFFFGAFVYILFLFPALFSLWEKKRK